jgi:hypothetical protein
MMDGVAERRDERGGQIEEGVVRCLKHDVEGEGED